MSSDLEKCMELAAPLLPEFHEAWHTAMAKYRSYPPEFTAEHDDTTAANCIRSHMWKEVTRRFDGRPGCVLRSLQRLNVLIYRDAFVWRFKKVDAAGRHQNYQTDQQRDFDDQKPLPFIPDAAVRLTSGYQPDATGQAIERIIVARPFGRSIQWTAQINVVDSVASWIDITPQRLDGTERFDRKRPRSGEVG